MTQVLQQGRRRVAQFDWPIARLETTVAFSLEGTRLEPGNHALIVIPNRSGQGIMLEVRRIPPGEFLDPRAFAVPSGDTVLKVPFERTSADGPLIEALTIDASPSIDGGVTLSFRYGDWRALKDLRR